MANSPFSRVSDRLRGISRIGLQVAQAETADLKVIDRHPAGLREMAQKFRESAQILEEYANEDEVSLSHRREDAEALVTLAQTAANVATIIGSDGGNLKIILFADPVFILEILTEGQEEALQEAHGKLPLTLKNKYIRQMGGVTLKQLEEQRKAIVSRWLAFVETLPEGVMSAEDKARLTEDEP